MVCLDEMGPESAKSFAGQQLIDATTRPAERAKQEIDYGRRGKGYIFGAFQPATGEAFTGPYAAGPPPTGCLPGADRRLDPARRRAGLCHPRQPQHAPRHRCPALRAGPSALGVRLPAHIRRLSRISIEPWWKILRSLALKGRRFETWEDICRAVRAATTYWNAHRHPFVWGRRRRHRPRRAPASPVAISRMNLPDAPHRAQSRWQAGGTCATAVSVTSTGMRTATGSTWTLSTSSAPGAVQSAERGGPGAYYAPRLDVRSTPT